MNEIWRTIRGWEGLYQASSDGRIRSLDHLCGAIGGVTAGIYQALKKGYKYKNYKWEYVN